jgi:hypothetical protein
MARTADYPSLVAGMDPNVVTKTEHTISRTWWFDEFYVQQVTHIDTGEITWRRRMRQAAKNPRDRRHADDFYIVFREIRDHRLSGKITHEEASLLHALIENIGWQDNYVYNEMGGRMSCRQVSDYTRMDKNRTLRLLNELQEKGYIVIEKSNRGSSIRVKSQYAWRGPIKNRSDIQMGVGTLV